MLPYPYPFSKCEYEYGYEYLTDRKITYPYSQKTDTERIKEDRIWIKSDIKTDITIYTLHN